MLDLTEDAWLNICPDLTIGVTAKIEHISFSEQQLNTLSDQFWSTGYLAIAPHFNSAEIARLVAGLEALDAANIPPVFIYMFDQPWILFEKLRHLIGHFLGEEYALLPNFWAWHLKNTGQTGWPPHRDCDADTVFNVGPDKMLMSLSLWVPLTDVDVDNGCMYVIERAQEQHLNAEGRLDRDIIEAFATPLPAKAGAVLGWPQDLVHWGGNFTHKAKNSRMSLSFEFQNKSFEPLTEPLLDTGTPPNFNRRFEVLKAQFKKYRHMDPNLGTDDQEHGQFFGFG